MGKTIGIVTCHTPLNYGAMLQAYGLQKYLILQGYEPEIINYAPDRYLEEVSLLYIGDNKWKKNIILRLIYLISKFPSRIKRLSNFKQFREKYIRINHRRYLSYEELEQDYPIYDEYICGSDQIWNTRGLRGWDPTFYLCFVKDQVKRHSYAASMSLDIPISQDVIDKVFPRINDLKGVAVRENQTVDEIQPYIASHVIATLDPVYLLSQKEWSVLADSSRNENKDFILIYPMEDMRHVLENARKLSEETGLPIYCISASLRKIPGVTKRFDCSIPKFVNLFREAKYVITNSFHGTSFSIIFRKNFWSCEVGNNNHRITGILKKFNLSSRYVPIDKELDCDALNVDYTQSEEIIEKEINLSKKYLNAILK